MMGLKEDLEIVMNMKPLGHKQTPAPQAKLLSEDRLALIDLERAKGGPWSAQAAKERIDELLGHAFAAKAAAAAREEQVMVPGELKHIDVLQDGKVHWYAIKDSALSVLVDVSCSPPKVTITVVGG